MPEETQIASFFGKYEPTVAALGKAARAKLRRRLPGLCEVVYYYENQHALVISYSPTENGYEGICTLALRPGEAKLHFANGAQLSKADPGRLLQGKAGTRFVVLAAAADLDRAEIEALLAAAVKLAKLDLDPRAKGAVILRTEAQKQRAAKATKAKAAKAKRPR